MELKNETLLSPLIADSQGMINVDSSEFIKKGKESVGVARQYCGAIGKVENCQSGVFVGYSSEKGYSLLTGRLYMPEIWFSPEYAQRRKENLVPEDLTFQTKIQIALELIDQVDQTKLFPAKWIGCDATFGSDAHFLTLYPKSPTTLPMSDPIAKSLSKNRRYNSPLTQGEAKTQTPSAFARSTPT